MGRRWTILHQIVFCGNINHLNEVLGYQVNNPEFNFLFKALDDRTIREVATERAHIHPHMMHHVERLVFLDQLFNYAREGKWDLLRQSLHQKPNSVNEKGAHRRYYLGHYLASIGQLDVFRDLKEFCDFKFGLRVGGKRMNQIARENNHNEFADYVEELCPNIDQLADEIQVDEPQFSASINDFPAAQSFMIISAGNPEMSITELLTTASNTMHHATTNFHHEVSGSSPTTAAATAKPKLMLTADDKTAYEQKIQENASKTSASIFIASLICPITKSIMQDPVMAADGYTYERSAIEKWFTECNRSPLTNQELANCDLFPNHAINSMLTMLADVEKAPKSD